MPTQRLTTDRIAAAALRLVDSAGPRALTMRALAEHLGVGTMTLYGYYRSRDELLDAVVDAATTDAATVEQPADGDPRTALTSLFARLHRVLTAHPGLHRVRRSRPFLSPGVLRLTDRAVDLLLATGLDETTAVRAYRILYLYTLGCVTYAVQDPDDIRHSLDALPPGDFPHLGQVASTMVDVAGAEDEFEHGLATLVAALTPVRGQRPCG